MLCFLFIRRERAGALCSWATVKWEACEVKLIATAKNGPNPSHSMMSPYVRLTNSVSLICCFRAESLLKNYDSLQPQRNMALFYGKDIGMGVGRRPLDVLNRDKNWAMFFMASCFSLECVWLKSWLFISFFKSCKYCFFFIFYIPIKILFKYFYLKKKNKKHSYYTPCHH